MTRAILDIKVFLILNKYEYMTTTNYKLVTTTAMLFKNTDV